MADKYYLGIDLGGTKIAAGVVSQAGELLARLEVPTPAREGPQAVVNALVKAARQVARQADIPLDRMAGTGIGAPGPIESLTGVVTAPPNLPGWDAVPLGRLVEKRLGVSARLDNDANAAALAEYHFGAGRGCRLLLYVTISTGIGSAIVLQGRLFTGVSGAAGELGHLVLLPDGPRCGCGAAGCLEALASGTAIARNARALVKRGAMSALTEKFHRRPGRVTAEDVAQAADEGDPEAGRILSRAMDYLGVGLANATNLLNPDCIVVGGGLTHLGPKLLDPVRQAIARQANAVASRAVAVIPAELGPDAGVIGAAVLAMPS